jgi:predicted metal-dependent hydrolase
MSNLSSINSNVAEGIRLFNGRKYFEAHEALEFAWREETGPIRDLYRGILQVAVCYLHITHRNYNGALKMFERSRKWLTLWPDVTLGIHVALLREDLARAVEELRRLGREGIDSYDLSQLKPIVYEETGKINCDRCGSQMMERDCKIICPNCGNRFDCSDLTIYFDELH